MTKAMVAASLMAEERGQKLKNAFPRSEKLPLKPSLNKYFGGGVETRQADSGVCCCRYIWKGGLKGFLNVSQQWQQQQAFSL
jgi:hypothetical protein